MSLMISPYGDWIHLNITGGINKLIHLKKRHEKSIRDADDMISLADNSYLSYKNMENIEEEQNKIIGQGYGNNKLNSSMMIRTNSKVSVNTNSGSNMNSNREGAKAIMYSMLKKKSTMLFVQETKDSNKNIPAPPKLRESVSPKNVIRSTFSRRTTLMPDFKSSLLNRSSHMKKKNADEPGSKPKKKDSTQQVALKKFKSFREQPVNIVIEGFDINKNKNTNNSKPSNNNNISSRSGRPFDESNDIDSFKSAYDPDAIEMKNESIRKSVSPNENANNMLSTKPQNFTDVYRRATIQEVSEEKEIGDVVLEDKSPGDKNKIPKNDSKATGDYKDAEDNELISFQSEDSGQNTPEKDKKPLMLPDDKDENNFIEKTLDSNKSDGKNDEKNVNESGQNQEKDVDDVNKKYK